MTTSPSPTEDTVLTPQLCTQGRERAQPVIDWLFAMRLQPSRISQLFEGFLRELDAVGIPVDRSTLHLPQLHPQLRARTVLWEDGEQAVVEIPRVHGIEHTEFFLKSPIKQVFDGGPAVRRRLGQPGCPLDFPITEELHGNGYRDYTVRPLPFSNGQVNGLTLSSKQDGGFSDCDIATVEATLPAFGLLLELRHAYVTAQTLMETYLGTRSGQRVLAGTIRRGHAERINAVLLTSDLRCFTELSESLTMEEVVDLLDEYFEIMGVAIVESGGEILKFIGDGILAIFPTGEAGEAATCSACEAAMQAARRALQGIHNKRLHRESLGLVPYRAGIALHLGDVLYGNIGAADRLDFTVIGPAVNLVSRIEALNQALHLPLVFSADFAASWKGAARSLGLHQLKGIADPQEVFTLADTAGLPGQD
ncbi:adenylate/guanylate cyclase domain-containing protein [Pelagibius sp. CAU 1746]|uniref:adenylate/guanylate cyclase domain-containing protein n=1 Tax=Pelagibius sp. CAU 1746 TaxID=3140370 RepID=UPI00325B4DCB